MRAALKAIIYLIVSFLLFFVIRAALPKYQWMMGYFLALWLLDAYLWISAGRRINRMPLLPALLTRFLYWLPFILVIACVIYGHFYSFLEWNLILRTEVLNLILVGYAVKVPPIATRILYDLGRFIRPRKQKSPVYGTKRIYKGNWFIQTGWTLGIVLGVALLAGQFFWIYSFRIRQETLAIKNLPASFNGFRIVQISDLHLGGWTSKSKLKEAVEKVNSLRPDVVFVTGDLANYSTLDVLGFKDILKEIKARKGIFTVYGNHDYGQYYRMSSPKEIQENMALFGRFYEELGWKLLCNQEYILHNATDSIAILGVENWGRAKRFQKLGDIARAEKGTEHVATKFLLSHDPAYWEYIIVKENPEVDVTFSGHTHGGQVGIEIPGLRFSLISLMEPCWAGRYERPRPDGTLQILYVNRGLGTIGYEGRIGILPEITLFILKRGL